MYVCRNQRITRPITHSSSTKHFKHQSRPSQILDQSQNTEYSKLLLQLLHFQIFFTIIIPTIKIRCEVSREPIRSYVKLCESGPFSFDTYIKMARLCILFINDNFCWLPCCFFSLVLNAVITLLIL